jgi:hypothetical protein
LSGPALDPTITSSTCLLSDLATSAPASSTTALADLRSCPGMVPVIITFLPAIGESEEEALAFALGAALGAAFALGAGLAFAAVLALALPFCCFGFYKEMLEWVSAGKTHGKRWDGHAW